MDTEILLDRTAVCKKLGISRAYLWKLIKTGKFPAPLRIGKRDRWRSETIAAHFARLENAA